MKKVYNNKIYGVPNRTIKVCMQNLTAPTNPIWDVPDYDEDVSLSKEYKSLQGTNSWSVHQLRKSDTSSSTNITNSWQFIYRVTGFSLKFLHVQLLVFLEVICLCSRYAHSLPNACMHHSHKHTVWFNYTFMNLVFNTIHTFVVCIQKAADHLHFNFQFPQDNFIIQQGCRQGSLS